MKSTSIKVVLFSAFVMTGSLLALAGDRAVPPSGKGHAQDGIEISRALQQGKGTGMSLSQAVIRANANRVQTADEKAVVKQQPAAPHSNLSDSAFHK
jgi:hypothetical protein